MELKLRWKSVKIVYLKLGISRLTSKGKPNVEKEFEKTACKRKLHTNNDGLAYSHWQTGEEFAGKQTRWMNVCKLLNTLWIDLKLVSHVADVTVKGGHPYKSCRWQ